MYVKRNTLALCLQLEDAGIIEGLLKKVQESDVPALMVEAVCELACDKLSADMRTDLAKM